MIKENGIVWMTTQEISGALHVSSSAIGPKLRSLFCPARESHGHTYYRMLDVLQVAGVDRLCPACLEIVDGRKDKTYCSKPCRAAASAALEEAAGLLTLGVPPVPVAITGFQMRAIRKIADDRGLPFTVAVRLLLDEACIQERGNDE